MTVESDREDIIRHFTPKAPSIQSRLKTVDKLRAAHIPTQIAVAPVLPCTNQFGERLAKHVDRVTIDDYFMGMGQTVVAHNHSAFSLYTKISIYSLGIIQTPICMC